MNLGTWRIVVVVALVVAGVAVLANGFSDGPSAAISTRTPEPTDGEGDGASPTATASPTAEPEQTPAPNTEGVLVKVFNGTSAAGLAAQVQGELVEAGQVAPEDPADAPAKPAPRTIVYYRGGPDAEQNKADATFIAETYLEATLGRTPRIDELSAVYTDVVGETITVVVLLGDDYAKAEAAG